MPLRHIRLHFAAVILLTQQDLQRGCHCSRHRTSSWGVRRVGMPLNQLDSYNELRCRCCCWSFVVLVFPFRCAARTADKQLRTRNCKLCRCGKPQMTAVHLADLRTIQHQLQFKRNPRLWWDVSFALACAS